MVFSLYAPIAKNAWHEYMLGEGDFVYCFFSNISYHLEGAEHWGTRFPRLLLDLCDYGEVKNEYLEELKAELHIVGQELSKISVKDAVYDLGDLSKPIPWDVIPGEENNNLAQPWVSPRDTGFGELFAKAIDLAEYTHSDLYLQPAGLKCDFEKNVFKGRAFFLDT